MKTRFAIFTLLLMASVTLLAQTHVEQKGYVRSIGRPGNKYGERLEGATIRVNGQHNDVRSDANGDFTIAFDDATVGVTSYSLSRVRLSGYEVNEKEVIGRQFAVSAEVPHEIVMVSLAEKQKIEDSVVARVDRRYKTKLAQLEREKEQLGEEYHTQLQKLFDEYGKREQLISDMVERYANTDYAKLDSTAAKINAYIESGELEKADSIIQTMNVSKLESEYKAIRDDNDRLRAELQKGEKAEDNLYQNLYTAYNGKYEIFAQQFENDSAAFYLEKIVELDTTNVENLIEVGSFVLTYLADYEKAMKYAQSALKNSELDGTNANTHRCYELLGMVYNALGQYSEALICYESALQKKFLFYNDSISIDIADSYNNIGTSYFYLGDYDKGLDYAKKALEISIGEDCEKEKVATIYHNVGVSYMYCYRYEEGLEYVLKSLDIWQQLGKNININVAHCHKSIGTAYKNLNSLEKAMEHFQQALNVYKLVLGELHPFVANVYSDIAECYDLLGVIDKAEDFYKKALEIYNAVYGEKHPLSAWLCNNIGVFYNNCKNYSEALAFYNKALKIYEDSFGKDDVHLADVYGNIGTLYAKQGNYSDALNYLSLSLQVNTKYFGVDCPQSYYDHNSLGFVYNKMGNYRESFMHYKKAFDIGSSILGFSHPSVIDKCRCAYISLCKMNVNEEMHDFLSTKLFVAQFPTDSTSKSELQGDFYLLQLGDWNMESIENVFDTNKSLNGKKRNVVLYKDGKIISRKLDKKTTFDLILKEVGKEEHDAVMEAWRKFY